MLDTRETPKSLYVRQTMETHLGPPVVPFYPFFGEGSPTKIDYRKKGSLILSSLLEDLATVARCLLSFWVLLSHVVVYHPV